ncbi:MAG: endo alpha-1,4 polygalactosaminidase [Verrucomicrobiae bacterium]
MKRLAGILLAAGISQAAPQPASGGGSLYINYSARVSPGDLAAYTTSIIHPGAQAPLHEAKAAGCTVLAYLSAVEVARDAPYRKRFLRDKIPILGRNETWASDLADVSSPLWEDLLADLADEAAAQGFDGFFLDTLDSVEVLAQKHPSRAGALRAGLVRAIREIRRRHPDKTIIVNRGFSILEEIRPLINGVLAESLYQTYFFDRKAYGEVSEQDTSWLVAQLHKAAGLPIYVVDYVDPDKLELARKTAEKIREAGFIPYVTTPDLCGKSLAPIRPVARKIAAVYGRQVDLEGGGSRYWPADTWIAQFLQLPLEWMGYEVVYLDAMAGPLPALDETYAAIVFDAATEWPGGVQKGVLLWLSARRGLPVLIFGKIPFDGRYAVALGKLLGMEIDARKASTLNLPAGFEARESPVLKGESPPRMVPSCCPSVRAPAKADVLVSAKFTVPGSPEAFPYDAVFLAPWGGVALAPFLRFERPDNVSLWGIDPFAFLEAALRPRSFPAPDATTRDGLRLFFSHVDSDGFSNRSAVVPGKLTAEVIRDEIYKKYPVPVTSSIIEAEIRGFLKGQAPGEGERLAGIARDIFALPNIRIASHTYSHPFFWIPDDKTASLYETQSLELGDEYNMGKIDPVREVRSSVEYIRRELAPAGKPVDLILWSGNCRPGPEALAVADGMPVENLNGGDTVISRARPSLSSVAPLSMSWGGRLQVYAAVQNEMLFTNGFQGPRWGGYANVIQTFERTGSPRRLKPVNIYFHMFMADRLESLNSLRTVFDWAVARPLQATTAAEYARIVRQTHGTAVFSSSPTSWIVVHGPDLRTFRLPDSGLKPDFSASKNLTGFNIHEGQMYFSTGASPRSEIVLAKSPPAHIYLESSTAEAEVTRFEKQAICLKASDFRPVTVTLSGLAPSKPCSATVNGSAQTLTTDAGGRLVVTVGNSLELSIEGAPLP